MSAYLLWRIVKFVGLGLFAAGSLAGLLNAPDDRARLGLWGSSLGWLLTWTAGWGLIQLSTAKMSDPWVSAGMGFSLIAFIAGVGAAGAVRPRIWTAVATGGFVASVAVMVLRNAALAHPASLGLGLLAAVAAGMAARGEGEVAVEPTLRWFGVIAWLEGISLLALFGLYMPFKYGLHIELDGGQKWFGWMHGMFVQGYVGALVLTAYRAGWSFKDVVIGFVASFFPFGTFWFERRLHGR